ncbi:MAG: DUF3990 domain-containing protein [Lachnospiraceae bacterium]|nr:DUF3990 domain-containing protein [Lachnospiraceae bacterium]
MDNVILYHGSPEIVRSPELRKGKPYNDYGQGFYCTEHLELAKEWACTETADGYVNKYELNTSGLSVLNLGSKDYTILHWLAVLMEYRRFHISSPVMTQGAKWLKENFLIDLSPYDIVVGYRADDSYFSFARAFISNEISLHQLSYAMRLGNLGEQVTLKSDLAFEQIRFVSYEFVDRSIYFALRKARDDNARKAYRKELETEKLNGIYIRDLVLEGVKPDDPRLR